MNQSEVIEKISGINDNVLSRIQALFELSKSANENEASNAAEAAMRLLAKYNLSQDELSLHNNQDIMDQERIKENRNVENWKAQLLRACAKSNFCDMYTRRSRAQGEYVITGKNINRQATKMLFNYLVSMVELETLNAWTNYKGWENGKSYKNAFRLGMINRIEARLAEERRNIIMAQTFELVVYDPYKKSQEEIKAFYAKSGIRLRNIPTHSSNSMAGYSAGKNSGDKVALNGNQALPMRGTC